MAMRTATVGTRAPGFTVPATDGPGTRREVSLDDYLDRWLVLLFYPRDFTLVCPTELTAFSNRVDEFRARECDLLGISTDTIETHEQWLAAPRAQGGLGGLGFPLAADAEGDMSRAYGVYVEKQHLALRGLFIIDPNGVLQYQVVHNLSVGRSAEEVLRVLEGLQMGGLCPADRPRGEAALDLSRELGPNRIIGPYRIEASLGGGGFGNVFRARDLTLERTVALKVLRPGTSVPPQTLLAEARAAAALNHPNLCTIHSVDSTLGAPIIVMEYVDGHPLAQEMATGPLPAERVVALGRQIALGMAEAHAQGVVHGDLKPGNILVTAAGIAKIVDFGLARRHVPQGDGDATRLWTPSDAEGLHGTPAYMAPEQARGEKAVPASDVFALGLILYEMITGRRARTDGSLFDMIRKIEQPIAEPFAAETPEPFAGILRQSLAIDPNQRTTTMAQIADKLAR
jgi:eukaryotic-like serine/threonine-protein kinase